MSIKYRLIDVSYHNGDIDFKKVKADGIQGVIIRAGYGMSTVDKNFHTNIQNAIKNGLHVGVYWFGYAYSESTAETEAKFFTSVLSQYSGSIDLPVFYDWEYDSFNYAKNKGITPTKAKISSWVDRFCSVMENNGYFVGVYGNLDYLNNYFNDTIKTKYTIWVAQWASKCTYSGDYGIWQYGAETNKIDSKTVDGISGVVDKNYCYVEYPDIIVNKGFNGYVVNLIDSVDDYEQLTDDNLDMLKKYLLGTYDGDLDTALLDINQDGKINSADLLALKKKLANLD
ncbi:MAG: dockerin type I domain-containing protein [Ruminococcus sp.]|nr:dockerin type I domain-containing protein [Ruminococcus sp.]MCD7799980.1 dockerin type I domain-containing protein [Ruminococcus sp.]